MASHEGIHLYTIGQSKGLGMTYHDETSALHIDLISDLKRINSHICSIAYPILESAGALTKTRIRNSRLLPLSSQLPDDPAI